MLIAGPIIDNYEGMRSGLLPHRGGVDVVNKGWIQRIGSRVGLGGFKWVRVSLNKLGLEGNLPHLGSLSL